MNQYVYSIKLTPRGQHYCVAYTAQGNQAAAVSRNAYDNANDAINDVMQQLGLSPGTQPVSSGNYQRIPSAAAGGVR